MTSSAVKINEDRGLKWQSRSTCFTQHRQCNRP